AGTLAGDGDCRRSASAKNGDKNCRRLAAGAAALHAATRGSLHHLADGDGSDLRHDFSAVRIPEPHHRSAAVYDFGHGRDPERARPDTFRAETLSTNQGRNACMGTRLSPAALQNMKINTPSPIANAVASAAKLKPRWLNRTVLGIGLASLFSDM